MGAGPHPPDPDPADAGRVSRRVLVVDDHGPFRSAVRGLLAASGYEVVGEAADGRSALAECQRLDPDVVLLDVQLPDLDGFEVAAALAASSRAHVVLTSSRDRAAYRKRLAASTVRGFVHKPDLSAAALDTLLD
jgi:DNA-binding NarL/FixJ family response regulator